MIEPWFNPAQWAWLPGTVLGGLGGLWGALIGILAPRGKGKAFAWTVFWALFLSGFACLIAGIVALLQGQPYGVWYGLLLGGGITTLVVGGLGIQLGSVYRKAEERKMMSQDAV